MALKVGINGFGRIGRLVFAHLLSSGELVEVVAINDITDARTLAHLLKYDSNYGIFPGQVSAEGNYLKVDGKLFPIFSEKIPENIPWKKMGVDYVLECTGIFTHRGEAEAHLKQGVKRVIISAPSEDADATIIVGINENTFQPEKHRVISNASCTTHCLAAVAKALHDAFGIEYGLVSTTHAYTNDQRILDLPHKDLRRARAAALSIIPTATGAAKAIHLVIPELRGKMHGLALRVPVSVVSLLDLVALLKKPATEEEVNQAFLRASQTYLRKILDITFEPLVSSDFKKNPHSAIVDGLSTMVRGNLVKVLAWYDNEWGYASHLADLVIWLGKVDRLL
ncbi:MAG: type I glyceraldehyde-3-phosphate dehydrogenase [bacterium JZ-2024 1]